LRESNYARATGPAGQFGQESKAKRALPVMQRYGDPMITAIVFVKADVARIPEVAEAIASLDGVSEVYSVTGQIDLIALGGRRHRDGDAHRLPHLLEARSGVGLQHWSRLSHRAGRCTGEGNRFSSNGTSDSRDWLTAS
jgi:DNA-binding Lrp family transcriptional regulator